MFKAKESRHLIPWIVGVWLTTTATFLFFQTQTIFGGDAGDFVAASCVGGVPHPPGFPLYAFFSRLLYFLPWNTPAWRVGLLSSIPAGITVVLVFLIIWQISKNKTSALIGSLSLAFSYLFWLYAEVPEVFSLNSLFLVILTYLTIKLIENFNQRDFKLIFLTAGLSASHHHYSLWFYPVLFISIWYFNRDYFEKDFFKKVAKPLPYFLLGLVFYFYLPWAASKSPVINWNNPVNLKNIFDLVTRRTYGTFLSQKTALLASLGKRLFMIWGGILLFLEYFSWIGLFFLLMGFLYLKQKSGKIFKLFLGLFLWQLFFFFYSGFTLDAQSYFRVGVFSRFMLPMITWSGVLIGLGMLFVVSFGVKRLRKKAKLTKTKSERFKKMFLAFLIIYPLALFFKNIPVFLDLKNDLTAEKFAQDILDSASRQSIVMLSLDNDLFNSQYIHYCLGYRSDIDLIHFSVFQQNFYYTTFKNNYPELGLPKQNDPKFLSTFLDLNSQKEIYTNLPQRFPKGSLVPSGLLYHYYPDRESLPEIEKTAALNHRLWSMYHNPFSGILSWFRPTTLLPVVERYQKAAESMAVILHYSEKSELVKEYIEKVNKYNLADDSITLEDLIETRLENQKKLLEDLD